jgi:hypothetical protein
VFYVSWRTIRRGKPASPGGRREGPTCSVILVADDRGVTIWRVAVAPVAQTVHLSAARRSAILHKCSSTLAFATLAYPMLCGLLGNISDVGARSIPIQS